MKTTWNVYKTTTPADDGASPPSHPSREERNPHDPRTTLLEYEGTLSQSFL